MHVLLLRFWSRGQGYFLLRFSSSSGAFVSEFHLPPFFVWVLVSLEENVRMLALPPPLQAKPIHLLRTLHPDSLHHLLPTKRFVALFLHNNLLGSVFSDTINFHFDRVDNDGRDSCLRVQEGLLEDRDNNILLTLILY